MIPPSLDPKKDWQFSISAEVSQKLPATENAKQISKMFGISSTMTQTLYKDFNFSVAPGEILAIAGPSGAGKSILLREVASQVADTIMLDDFSNEEKTQTILDLFSTDDVKSVLGLLARVGLAEAHILLTPACKLSAGQQYRLGLARAIFQAKQSGNSSIILADEFCSCLDLTTATILCRQIRKIVSREKISLIVATPRVELLSVLKPNRIINKPIGQVAKIENRAKRIANLPDPARWKITQGKLSDYKTLAQYHYIAGPPAIHKRVYKIEVPQKWQNACAPQIAAAIVVSPPTLCVRGRNVATLNRYLQKDKSQAAKQLNNELELISRVVVHPIFRGAGLAVRLVKHVINTSTLRYVEALAAMGKMHPMFKLAGMKHAGIFLGRSNFYHYYFHDKADN